MIAWLLLERDVFTESIKAKKINLFSLIHLWAKKRFLAVGKKNGFQSEKSEFWIRATKLPERKRFHFCRNFASRVATVDVSQQPFKWREILLCWWFGRLASLHWKTLDRTTSIYFWYLLLSLFRYAIKNWCQWSPVAYWWTVHELFVVQSQSL